MSKIDLYKHNLIGFIYCESDYEIVYGNDTRKIAIYKLEQEIPIEEIDFDGKLGDILIGGGKGESPAFRISCPQVFEYFNGENLESFDQYDQLFKCFWSATDSFKLCNGFQKSKWNPDTRIEIWLASQICSILSMNLNEYSEYAKTNRKIELKYELLK